MTIGAWVILAAVALALGFGGYRALTDGRFRGTRLVAQPEPGEPIGPDHSSSPVPPTPATHLLAALPDAPLGERATLLQFSSAFCAPCRATRRVLSDVAAAVPGVEHVEVDAEHHLALVRELGILRTPTTLVLDSTGVEVSRAAGAPRKEQVLEVLAGTVT